MTEYISRAKIAAEVKSLSTHPLNEWDSLGVLMLIDRQPAADVAPIVHGKWDDDSVAFFRKCSVCGCCIEWAQLPFLDGDGEYNYCPRCGAKMDERSEDE